MSEDRRRKIMDAAMKRSEWLRLLHENIMDNPADHNPDLPYVLMYEKEEREEDGGFSYVVRTAWHPTYESAVTGLSELEDTEIAYICICILSAEAMQ